MLQRYIFIGTILLLSSCAESLGSNSQNDKTLSSRDDSTYELSTANIDCPVGLVSGLTLDEEFGPGTQEKTRCIEQHEELKILYQVNKTCKDSECSKPFALGNVINAINDYEITNGLQLHVNYDITMVVYSSGYQLVLDNNAAEAFPEENPFQAEVEELLARGVHIYFCQNTARNKGIVTANLIPGIEWVTSGVTAVTDFQLMDYANINP